MTLGVQSKFDLDPLKTCGQNMTFFTHKKATPHLQHAANFSLVVSLRVAFTLTTVSFELEKMSLILSCTEKEGCRVVDSDL